MPVPLSIATSDSPIESRCNLFGRPGLLLRFARFEPANALDSARIAMRSVAIMIEAVQSETRPGERPRSLTRTLYFTNGSSSPIRTSVRYRGPATPSLWFRSPWRAFRPDLAMVQGLFLNLFGNRGYRRHRLLEPLENGLGVGDRFVALGRHRPHCTTPGQITTALPSGHPHHEKVEPIPDGNRNHQEYKHGSERKPQAPWPHPSSVSLSRQKHHSPRGVTQFEVGDSCSISSPALSSATMARSFWAPSASLVPWSSKTNLSLS